VWQMTSDVVARTRAGCSLADVFAALFPCGSVTGAPKVRAMQAIRALEPGPRGVYCGALGVVQPGGAATFNVPIRTVSLRGTTARCGIGSGITSGAAADGEWREWQLKQAFVQRASAPFALLETMGLADGRLRDAEAHLARMAQAARHFGYPWDAQQAKGELQALVAQHAQGTWRVRLLLDAEGRAQAEAYALPASPAHVRLQLADRAFDEAHGEFVRFKTTRRAHYEAFAPKQPGVFDTLLWNAEGEITECTRGNVAFLLDGHWVTPPLHCGLLAGVGRDRVLREQRVSEAVVRLQDLPRVQALAFVNSLRGWIPADLDSPRLPALPSEKTVFLQD
jgi:para-aminobenzoate synthetase/4-amino-4-deoxychorismate lyase